MAFVLGAIKGYGRLDFVACWLFCAAKYAENSDPEISFVVTNSLCQGEQVSLIWPEVFRRGLSIGFAFSTFEWKNQAKGNAGVHVAVVGLSKKRKEKLLYVLDKNKQWRCEKCENISPYLVSGPDIIVSPSRKPLISSAIKMENGSEYSNSEPLILTAAEREMLKGKPEDKWVKRLVGSSEFINNKERYCLWLTNASAEDINSSGFLSERVERTRKIRLSNPDFS